MDRRTALFSLFGVGGVAASVRFSRLQSSTDPSTEGAIARARPVQRLAGVNGIKTVEIAQIPIGGGGFVTGIDISADGRRFVCRTDVANAYVRDVGESAWRPFFSPSTMQPADYDPLPDRKDKADGGGVAGIRIAPSNPDVIVASYYGYIWRSADGGRSVQRTNLTQKAMPSNNGLQRLYNRTIDIHPRDPRQILVGTSGEGVWFTLDGGERWSRADLPEAGKSNDGLPGNHLVLFDPSAPERVYAFVAGVGLFRSSQGPAGAFEPLTGGPAICSSLVASLDGTLFLCEQTKAYSGQVWRYHPSRGWVSSKPEHEAMILALDPGRPGRVLASNPNGYFMESQDSGQTWRSIGGNGWNASGGEVGWTRGMSGMFPAEMRFDPRQPNQLFIAQGIGVAKAKPTSTKFMVEDWSAGIEELCAVSSLIVPGGETLLSAWDKSFWRLSDMTAYTNDFRYPVAGDKPHDPTIVAYGSYMDYAADDPNFIVGLIAPTSLSAPGYTNDGGKRWKVFPGAPASGWGHGGCIAASTRDNIVLLPSNNAVGVFTLDGGKSWEPVKLDGVNPTGGFANAYSVPRKNLTADKTRKGTFALVYTILVGSEYGNPLGGVWLTRDGGKTWSQILKGVISTGDHDPKAVRFLGLEERQFWSCQLDYVPGRSGELVYTPHADYAGDRFFWSRDDGRSWTELDESIRNVRTFGFGKAAPGQDRPAIYFWGEIGKRAGLYASFDWFRTPPKLITRFPSPILGGISSIAGDMTKFGRLIVGTSCTGWLRIDVEA
jgi:hypothetical protein